eukprot:96661-Pyramimonas_sp.AAC.1
MFCGSRGTGGTCGRCRGMLRGVSLRMQSVVACSGGAVVVVVVGLRLGFGRHLGQLRHYLELGLLEGHLWP